MGFMDLEPRVKTVTIAVVKTRVSGSNVNSNLCLRIKSRAATVSHPADTDFATLAATVRPTESQKDASVQVPKRGYKTSTCPQLFFKFTKTSIWKRQTFCT